MVNFFPIDILFCNFLDSEVSQNVKKVVDQLIKRLVNGNTELEEFGLVLFQTCTHFCIRYSFFLKEKESSKFISTQRLMFVDIIQYKNRTNQLTLVLTLKRVSVIKKWLSYCLESTMYSIFVPPIQVEAFFFELWIDFCLTVKAIMEYLIMFQNDPLKERVVLLSKTFKASQTLIEILKEKMQSMKKRGRPKGMDLIFPSHMLSLCFVHSSLIWLSSLLTVNPFEKSRKGPLNRECLLSLK